MSDDNQPKRRTFRKFYFRGHETDTLLNLPQEEITKLLSARVRRKFSRGIGTKPNLLMKRLTAAKKNATAEERPAYIKTHLRNMIVVPEMIGSNVAIYNGKTFNQVEIKPEMVGHYLGEFSLTYKPVFHGRPGVGASGASKFIPLK